MQKPKDIKITYHYIEPKTPEEKADAERRISDAYAIIFQEAYEKMKLNKIKTKIKKNT